MTEARHITSHFEALLDAAPDAMVVVDDLGRLALVNSKFESMFGYARQDVMGRPIEVLLPERFRKSHQIRRTEYSRDLRARPMGSDLELRALRSDGSEFPVVVSLSPLVTADGVFVTAAVRDVSEREQADQMFRDLLEAAPDALLVVNAQGEIQLVNAQTERLFGYPRRELVGAAVELLLPERDRKHHPQHRARFHEAPRTRGMGGDLDLRARRKDGTEFVAEISLSPMQSSRGTLVTAAVRDVSERSRQERARHKALEDANRLKSEFLANMSHELRTPLNAIIGFARLMHHGRVGQVSDQQREYLGDILNSSNHLLQLINDILDLSKVEAGRMEFSPELIDIPQLLGEVRDTFRPLSAARQITVETDTSPDCSALEVDRAKLKQVLLNYVSNALKFTERGGRITLSARPEDAQTVRFEVSDTGMGIRPEDLASLFKEFRQLDTSPGKRHQGTGLGLALTKRLVEAQGGRVGVTSVFGKGSKFFATLPTSKAQGGSS